LGILLAIVAGFVAIPGVNMALVLVVLGLIAGITMPTDRFIPTLIYVLVLPIVGTALGNIPTVGSQLGAVANGLALLAAGAVASAIAIRLYTITKDDLTALAK
jgi:hypothetical protein